MGAKALNDRRSQSKQQDDGQPLETLFKKLVAHAQHAAVASAPSPPRQGEQDEPSSEVLFDGEIDGVRCLLARRHTPTDALHLSPREREVARMIAKGYPNKVVASVLEISVWTVSTHLRRIFAKLGVTSRAAMVAKMFKSGTL